MNNRLAQVFVVVVLIIGCNTLASATDIDAGDINSAAAAEIISLDAIENTITPVDAVTILDDVCNINPIAESINFKASTRIESGIQIARQIENGGSRDITNRISIAEITKGDAIEINEVDCIRNGRNFRNLDILYA
jgi:hypothetical protein